MLGALIFERHTRKWRSGNRHMFRCRLTERRGAAGILPWRRRAGSRRPPELQPNCSRAGSHCQVRFAVDLKPSYIGLRLHVKD